MKLTKCYPGFKEKALTLSYDDGIVQDVRLTELMRRYGLKGTFNLNSGLGAEKSWEYRKAIVRRIDPSQMREVYEGQEIAVHSKTHPHLEKCGPRELYAELFEDRLRLEERFFCKITGMALPFGTWNEDVYQAIRNLGFSYCRTVVSTHGFEVPEDFLLWGATCHHSDPELLPLGEAFLETKDELALFYLWGHSYEFDGNQDWDLIEAFAKLLSGREGIWYATNGEICSYLKAAKRLVTGEGFILNPSERDIWVKICGEARIIKPGEWVNCSKSS